MLSWKKLENIRFFQTQNAFQYFLVTHLQTIKKSYFLTNMVPYYKIIKQMVLCLVTDFYVSNFKAQGVQMKAIQELQEKKLNFYRNTKYIQSQLIFKGHMRRASVSQSLYLVVTKIAYEILLLSSEKITQGVLFQRLNFIYNKCVISNKCFQIIAAKLANNQSVSKSYQKSKKQHLVSISYPEKENTEFKKIFLSGNDGREQKKRILKITNPNFPNQKVLKLLRTAQQTIQKQQRKFDFVESMNNRSKVKLNIPGLKPFKERSFSCSQHHQYSSHDRLSYKKIILLDQKSLKDDRKLRISSAYTVDMVSYWRKTNQ